MLSRHIVLVRVLKNGSCMGGSLKRHGGAGDGKYHIEGLLGFAR